MKGKILHSYFFEDDCLSVVVKQTKYGTFYEEAECLEEDKDVMTQWDGCAFAEYKCDLAALKEKIKHFKARLKGMESAFNALAQTVDTSNEFMKKFNHQINIAKRDISKMESDYKYKSEKYEWFTDKVLNDRRELRSKIADKKS